MMDEQAVPPADAQLAPVTTGQHELPEDVIERAAALRRAGVPFVLATVVWSQRPTSARPGAKAVITADGALVGWVGGSCAQAVVVREAVAALADGQARLMRLSPDGDPADSRAGVVTAAMSCHSGGTLELFLEPCWPARRLVVVGESPIALALRRLGEVVGYRVVAIAAEAGTDRLALAALPTVVAAGPTSVVVASMGHYDDEAVELALRAGAEAVALVASRRRAEMLLALLAQLGLDETQRARLKAPAGLDIGAATPGEVAVSIIAELIARHAGRGRPVATEPVTPMSEARPSVAAEATPAANVATIPLVGQPPLVSGIPLTAPATAVDPVCGMSVAIAGTRHTAEHAGQKYYFCCPSCRRQFEREPQRFLAVAAG